jgi:NitT/TauT family transport system substrate-binding protein
MRLPHPFTSLPLLLSLALAACGGTAAPASSAPASSVAAKPASAGSSAAAKPSGSAAAGGEKLKLSVGLASKPAPPLPNSVLWLAKDLGYYDQEGLDVTLQYLDGTPTIIASMISGDVDVGNIGTDQAVKLVAQKSLDMRAIESSDVRQYFLIAARDSIATAADLKGKSYGVANVGSLDDRMSRLVLSARGVDPNQMTFVNIGAPDVRAQALVASRLDATTMSIGTWLTIQRQPGVKVLVNADDYYGAAPINLKINAATEKVIQAKPEQMRRFTAAVMKVSRAFAKDQKLWVDAMMKSRPDLRQADLEELWPQFKEAWGGNGLMNLDQYQKTSDYLYQTPDFKDVPKVPVSAWTDTQFVDSVLKQIGVDPNLDAVGRTI